jgi:uroporphyrinogen decarboxylase
METFSGRQRISAAFKKTFTDQDPPLDRVPAYIMAGQCNTQLIDATIREFFQDPHVFVKAQLAAYERYKPDIVVMMWDLTMDVEAMGNELRFPENSMCISVKEALEDKGNLINLEVPDPFKDGRLPGYLEACTAMKKALPDTIVSGVIAGPWTIAMGLRGVSNLIIDAMEDPEYVHELMEICTQATIRFTEAISELGVGVGYSEAPASCDLIYPEMYRTFVLPYHKRMVSHFDEKNVGVGLHICGNAELILDDMVETGASNLSVDSGTGFAKAVEACRGKAVLIGNVDTNLFMAKSKEQMRQAVQHCIDNAAADSGYILAPGCEIPALAPPEKVGWFMELAQEIGAYQQ